MDPALTGCEAVLKEIKASLKPGAVFLKDITLPWDVESWYFLNNLDKIREIKCL